MKGKKTTTTVRKKRAAAMVIPPPPGAAEDGEECPPLESRLGGKGGRPKGTTNLAKLQKEQQSKLALDWAIEEMLKSRVNGRVPRGKWPKILEEAKEKFPLADAQQLQYGTVKKRMKNGTTCPTNNQSSMHEL